jgi:pimeloyl-ACP methyl ester carboxylesterase
MRSLPRVLSALGAAVVLTAARVSPPAPAPIGALVDIGGGQRLHVNCRGSGSPAVLLESGTADLSVVWARVQPLVAQQTRVCSYDRAGYAWSDPGHRPRTFAQISLELHTALDKLHVPPPYVLVGQSYGGLVVRGFARRYRSEIAGLVLVDAVHEDQHIAYGGAAHLIRAEAKGRTAPAPVIEIDRDAIASAAATALRPLPDGPLEAPLDTLPDAAQAIWRWAMRQPSLPIATSAELDWSPEEFVAFHEERLKNRATLGSLPLAVLSRTRGGFSPTRDMTPAQLEEERTRLQADLAALSTSGAVTVAPNAGHNIHLEDPPWVAAAILRIAGR